MVGFISLVNVGCSKSRLSDVNMKIAVKQQADDCVQAWVRQDFDAFTARIHPRVLELAGGKEGIMRLMKQEEEAMKSSGGKIMRASVGEAMQIRKVDSDEVAVVPESIEISGPRGLVKAESFLLGISNDGGRTWKFVEDSGTADANNKIRTILPNLPGDFELPTRKEPVSSRQVPKIICRADVACPRGDDES